MPANFPDPSKIPDMSLGERSDQIMPVRVDPVPPAPAREDAVSSNPLPVSKMDAVPPDWREGDRVLAPWEPTFLYAGTIQRIKRDEARGDQALVEFDDGDDGWVFLYSIYPLAVTTGERVLSRRKMGAMFFLAEILEVHGEEVRVAFDEGGSEWTTVASLRIPCVENGPGAVGTKFGANRLALTTGQRGAGVPYWVIWVGLLILSAVIRIGCRAMNH